MTSRLTGEQLRALREQHGLTQRQLGQLARSTILTRPTGKQDVSTIQKWENGTNPIPLSTLELIVAKLFLLQKGLVTFEQLVAMSLTDILSELSLSRSSGEPKHKPTCARYNGEYGWKNGVACTCGATRQKVTQRGMR